MGGGGGTYYDKTAQGIVAAGGILDPSYGKMAADSIAKEVEERKLVPPTTGTEVTASSEAQLSPATGTNKIMPGETKLRAFAHGPSER